MRTKPRHIDWLIGFLAALAAFCFLQVAWDYQSSHCDREPRSAQSTPDNQHGGPSEGDKRDKKIDKHSKPEPSFACGILGLSAATVAFMDEHEGFVVGFFTLILAVSTTLLWRSTVDLYEAGERQGVLTKQSIDLASAEFNASHRTWLKVYPVSAALRFDGDKMILTITIEAQNVGQNPAVRVFLGCEMHRSRSFVAGAKEVAALVEAEKFIYSLPDIGSGEVLLPNEKTSVQFTVNDVQISAALEERVKQQEAFITSHGGSPPKDRHTLSFTYCALYKSLVSDDWRVSAHAGWLSKNDNSEFDPALGDVPADKIRLRGGGTNAIT